MDYLFQTHLIIFVLLLKPTIIVTTIPLGTEISNYFHNIIIPTEVRFFVIQGSECSMVFHATLQLAPKVVLVVRRHVLGHWLWVGEDKELKQAVLDLTGVDVSVGLTANYFAPLGQLEATFDIFMKKILMIDNLEDLLKFRFKVEFDLVEEDDSQSFSYVERSRKFVENGHADIAAQIIMINEEIATRNDFIQTGVDLRAYFIVRRPSYSYNWKSSLMVLEKEVWISIVPTLLLITLVLTFMARKLRYRPLSISSSFLMVYGHCCSQGSPEIPRPLSLRIVCLTSLMFSVVLNNNYISNLYSFLSSQEIRKPFASMEEFIEKKEFSLLLDPETSFYSAIKKADHGVLQRLWDSFLRDDPRHVMNGNNTGEAAERLCSGEASLLHSHLVVISNQAPCELVAMQPGYFPQSYTIIARKGFPFTRQFRYASLRSQESGLIHEVKKATKGFTILSDTFSIKEPVGIEQVLFHLIFYAVAIIMSGVVLSLEIAYFKRHCQRTQHMRNTV